jgi:hypothetical protein
MTNLDVSATALKQLKEALPNCEIVHRWSLDWVIAGQEHVQRCLKDGPVLVAYADEASEKRLDSWQNKLATRKAVLFAQKAKMCGVILFADSPEQLKALPAIDPQKAPQFFLYPKPDAKPVELSENATEAELLAAIEKALKP